MKQVLNTYIVSFVDTVVGLVGMQVSYTVLNKKVAREKFKRDYPSCTILDIVVSK